MNLRRRVPGLALLLLLATVVPAVAQDPPPTPPASTEEAPPKPLPEAPTTPRPVSQEIPKAAPRAPLPAEPKDAAKKAIQAALKRWFESESKIPVKGRNELEVKADRSRAGGDLETEVQKSPGILRLLAWWHARLEETQPSENKPAGTIRTKEEFVYGEGDKRKTYLFSTSVPTTYRGKGTDAFPVIITVLDKEADPKKVLKDVYGKLLDTHIVVASTESNVTRASELVFAISYAYHNFRVDRDRFVLDGIGKGARFVEELAAAEFATHQWNGVVIRSPLVVQPLEGNLGLFPVGVVEPAAPIAETVATAIEAHVAAGGPGTRLPAGDFVKVQDFIAGLPPRKVSNPALGYEMFFRTKGKKPTFGFWFLVDQVIDDETDQPVRVKITRDPVYNVVDIDSFNLAAGTLLLNDDVLDLDQTVYIRVNGIVVAKEKPVRTIKHTYDWSTGLATFQFAHRHFFVVAMIPFVVDKDAQVSLASRQAAWDAAKKASEDGKAEAGKSEEDRKKQEELDRLAAEAAKKAEEDAKNPPPAPAGGDPAPAPAGGDPAPTSTLVTEFYASLDEAVAAKRGRPILVVFQGAKGSDQQLGLDMALGNVDAKKLLAAADIVTIRPAEDGEAGKPTRDLLAKLSGAADTTTPFLVLFEKTATLSLKGKTKDAEILEALLEFLKRLTGEEPEKKPPTESKPVALEWGDDYRKALARADKPESRIAVLFLGAADAKGQKELLEAVTKDRACTEALSKMICVKLDTTGEAGRHAEELRRSLDQSHTAPVLSIVKVLYSDGKPVIEKDAKVTKTDGSVDPANLMADPATFLEKVRKQLAEAVPSTKVTAAADVAK